jgi:hypothetical protein
MKNVALALLALIMITACGQEKAVIKQLDNKAVAIHDEVMPKMGDIIELKGQVKARIESTSVEDETRAAWEAIYNRLMEAEQGMRDWMHQYEVPDFKKSMDELKPLVDRQLAEIEVVKEQMNSSIADARRMLAE